jgi:hypothetical protein
MRKITSSLLLHYLGYLRKSFSLQKLFLIGGKYAASLSVGLLLMLVRLQATQALG